MRKLPGKRKSCRTLGILGDESAKTKLLSAFIVALMFLAGITGFIATVPEFARSATADDWNVTNWNYTIATPAWSFLEMYATNDYVFTIDGDHWIHKVARSTGAFQANASAGALIFSVDGDGTNIYVASRNVSTSDPNCYLGKFDIATLTEQDVYYNETFKSASCVLYHNNYIYLSGGTDTSYAVILKLDTNFNEVATFSDPQGTGDSYIFEMDVDPAGEYMYAVGRTYSGNSYLYKFNLSTFTEEANITITEANNMRNCIVPTNNDIIICDQDYQKIWCFDNTLTEKWNITEQAADLVKCNETYFFTLQPLDGTEIVCKRYVSNGTAAWTYTGFDQDTDRRKMCGVVQGNYLYAYGLWNGTSEYILRNITIATGGGGSSYPSPPSGQSATAYTSFDISLSGLDTNTRITFPTANTNDTTGETIWSNETSISNDGIQQVNLSWTKGSGATNTYIRYATSDPGTWTLSTGTELYNGTGTSYNHQNLNAGTHYYYALWSWNSGFSETYVTCDAVAGNASVGNLTIHIEDVGSGTSLIPKENFTLYGNASGSYASLGAFNATTGNITLTSTYAGLPLAIGDKLYFRFKAVVGPATQPDGTYYDNNAQTLDCYVKAAS